MRASAQDAKGPARGRGSGANRETVRWRYERDWIEYGGFGEYGNTASISGSGLPLGEIVRTASIVVSHVCPHSMSLH